MKTLKKIYLGLISCAFLFTTLVTTTFAWFKLNSESVISDFDLVIEKQEGIRISIDGQNYTDDLSIEKLKMAVVAKRLGYTINNGELYNGNILISSAEIDEEYSNINLKPVTSTNGSTFTNQYGNPILVSTGNFVSLDLYFMYEKEDGTAEEYEPLYFVSDLIRYDNNNDGDYLDSVDFVVNPVSITSLDKSVKLLNSATSFKLLDIDPASPGDGIYLGGEDVIINKANAARFSTSVSTNSVTTTKVYDINTYDGSNVIGFGSYATDSTDEAFPEYDATKNLAYTYASNIHGNLNYYPKIAYSDLFGSNANYYTRIDQSINSATVGMMERDSTNTTSCSLKVTFNIWIEGSDADCIDMWGESPLNIQLSFGIDMPSALVG